MKLSPTLNVLDSFTPWNQDDLAWFDLDFGSGGVLLLPDQPGAHPHLMVAGGKTGAIYLVDRDNLGGYQQCGPNCDNVVQALPAATVSSIFDTPAYFNGRVYYHACCGDVLKAFELAGGTLSTSPVSQSTKPFNYPGAFPFLQTIE